MPTRVAPFARMRCSASMPAASAETRSVKLISRGRCPRRPRAAPARARRSSRPATRTIRCSPSVRHADPALHGIRTNRKKWAHSPNLAQSPLSAANPQVVLDQRVRIDTPAVREPLTACREDTPAPIRPRRQRFRGSGRFPATRRADSRIAAGAVLANTGSRTPTQEAHLENVTSSDYRFAPHDPGARRCAGRENRFRQGVRLLAREDVFDRDRHRVGQRPLPAPRAHRD